MLVSSAPRPRLARIGLALTPAHGSQWAHPDGQLELMFEGGASVVVGPDEQFEAGRMRVRTMVQRSGLGIRRGIFSRGSSESMARWSPRSGDTVLDEAAIAAVRDAVIAKLRRPWFRAVWACAAATVGVTTWVSIRGVALWWLGVPVFVFVLCCFYAGWAYHGRRPIPSVEEMRSDLQSRGRDRPSRGVLSRRAPGDGRGRGCGLA